MRFRVRCGGVSRPLVVPPGGSRGDLEELVKRDVLPELGLRSDTDFFLSLNGKDILPGNVDTPLQDCGVVAGDLIRVFMNERERPVSDPRIVDLKPMDEPQQHRNDQGSQASGVAEPSPVTSEVVAEDNASLPAAMEPSTPFLPVMLCMEAKPGHVPHSLEAALADACPQSAHESLIVALHVLMAEAGFVSKGLTDTAPTTSAGQLPEGWRRMGAYVLQYAHHLCPNASCVLACLPLGKLLVVNASVAAGVCEESLTALKLQTACYVTNVTSGLVTTDVYSNLPTLSRIFKDHVAYSALEVMRRGLELPPVTGLLALPCELLLTILAQLSAHSLLAMSATCRHLNLLSNDQGLWRHLFMRDFSYDIDASGGHWKQRYRHHYQMRCQVRHSLPVIPPGTFPFHSPYSYPPPFAPLPPGVIGGGYDTRPDFRLPFGNLPSLLLPRPRFDPTIPFPRQLPRGNYSPGALGARFGGL
uniref:F-box only protein 7 n=1 Tax=Myxine glutinosa TaxID=7769 RepID=UPI00358DFC73